MPDSQHCPPSQEADFRRLYDQHFAFVWRSLLRFGVETASREDLSHEVFIVYFKKYMDYQGPAAPSTLLYGIARRVASNHRRGASRRDQREQQGMAQPCEPQPGPEDLMLRQDAHDLVQRFLDTLSAENAEIFRLTQIEGIRAREVAEIFELNLNTLNGRVRSCKQKFEAYVHAHCPPTSVMPKEGGSDVVAQRPA